MNKNVIGKCLNLQKDKGFVKQWLKVVKMNEEC